MVLDSYRKNADKFLNPITEKFSGMNPNTVSVLSLENAVYGMNYFNVDVLQGYNSYINRQENIFTRLAVIDEILVCLIQD